MKKGVLCVLALTIGLSGCGGGSGPDALAKEQIKLMNEMAAVLESVKDDATADAAITKLKDIKKRGEELEKKMKDLKLSKDDEKKMEEKYKGEVEDAMKKVIAGGVNAGMKAPGKAKAFGEALGK